MSMPNLAAEATSPPRPKYLTILDQRRLELQEVLSRILTPGLRFHWEVGSGHGHFLTAYAAAHPDTVCIGVDIASERIQRAVRKRNRARLPNLHFIRADARFFLQSLPPGPMISALFVLFPDPWPKLRHHKHRVLQADFLAAAAAATTPDCSLHFRTDFRPYYDDACSTVRESTHWELLDPPPPWPFEFATVFQNRAKRHDSFIAQRRPSPA